ncbi:hypothetical protein A3H16_00690 [Candidatus Kaiserbacteria bacterium RIFCSPLOWO2_12_FULL_53_8]|uniref:Uncharacterized protein n=2 Tax=Candidatus Kaiseribacteriota TaxID=1752734 RepID=A0A1F6CYJ1_9BACT|nr:MAG: hypothetical protein A2851_01075 [Candidatus Kaiserbacteria bacterium RIFCSPHIGHO2_01_FULL_53_29]OGG90767.1 MAG: hypothetical protein A3H16_00690 [Candidatus Kaiserbacteria bacterium RIFCSPLOWO2_12_FULL_53_8]
MRISTSLLNNCAKNYGRHGKSKPSLDELGLETDMQLQYRDQAQFELQSFVDAYKTLFREIYLDSGLWNEKQIIEGYAANAHKIYDNITKTIDTHLSESRVTGRKRVKGNRYTILLNVGSRLVIVYYSEDKKQNIRWVESISIDRKPIIF